jgi:anti-sigma factor RsiW
MTMSISPGDWETLSAYVDNHLGERERVQIEARLQAEPELQRALQEIRRAKAVLWYAPRRRAPRNFTLSPGKAGVRLASPLYPTFRLASVLASLMFILVLAGDLLAGVTTGIPILAQMAPRESAVMQAVELAMPASAPLVEAPSEAFSQNADQAALAPAPTQVPESTQAAAPALAEEYGVGGGPAAKAAPTASLIPPPAPTSTASPTATPAAEIDDQPEQPAQGKQSADTNDLARAEPTASTLFTIPYINHWLVWGLEGLLLGLAGLALVAALLTRRIR